jgi:hypothetical protein
MGIILTMDEVKEILEKCVVDGGRVYQVPKLPGLQLRHVGQAWRNYLNRKGMSIAEYNNKMDDLNEKRIQSAVELKNELLLFNDPTKIFEYIKKLSMELQYNRRERRERDQLDVLGDKKYLRRINASYFAMMLGMENNSRNMGYENYQALCDWRNEGY